MAIWLPASGFDIVQHGWNLQ